MQGAGRRPATISSVGEGMYRRAYGGKAMCVACGSEIHAGIVRWQKPPWARCICASCYDVEPLRETREPLAREVTMPLSIREVGQAADPVSCPFCEVVVLPPSDVEQLKPWIPAPGCSHVWGLWHDHGVVYLSTDARAQLAASGVFVLDGPDRCLALGESADSDFRDDPHPTDVLTRMIHGPGANVLAVYTGPPGSEASYVGVAERLG